MVSDIGHASHDFPTPDESNSDPPCTRCGCLPREMLAQFECQGSAREIASTFRREEKPP